MPNICSVKCGPLAGILLMEQKHKPYVHFGIENSRKSKHCMISGRGGKRQIGRGGRACKTHVCVQHYASFGQCNSQGLVLCGDVLPLQIPDGQQMKARLSWLDNQLGVSLLLWFVLTSHVDAADCVHYLQERLHIDTASCKFRSIQQK